MTSATSTSATNKIAALVATDSAATQTLLAEIVADWRAAGARIAGVIAEPHGLPDRVCGAGILRDITSGKPYPMYRDAPQDPASCHLDAAGVVGACAAVLRQIPTSDLVVLNKFGKLEAMGKGLAPAFDAAVAIGKPVLTTVSRNQIAAWQTFTSGAIVLMADKATLQNWWLDVKPQPQQA
jgi:nucleoside-triphosphatase THEP1